MSKKAKAVPAAANEHDYDTTEGVRAAVQAAKAGDKEAAETLARRLSWILGGEIPFDDTELDELIAVAEAGWNSILSHPECHPEDMFQYAVDILWDDEGVLIPDNASDGAGWMLRAAEGGHPDAQLEVGRLYSEGVGLKKSDELALEWLNKAAADELNAEHATFFISEIQKKSGKTSPKGAAKKITPKTMKKSPAKKSVVKKAAAKKTPVKKATAKKPAAKKAAVKKTAVKKAVKAPAKKAAKTVKKTVAKVVAKAKTVAKKAVKAVKDVVEPTAKKKAPAKKKTAKK